MGRGTEDLIQDLKASPAAVRSLLKGLTLAGAVLGICYKLFPSPSEFLELRLELKDTRHTIEQVQLELKIRKEMEKDKLADIQTGVKRLSDNLERFMVRKGVRPVKVEEQ